MNDANLPGLRQRLDEIDTALLALLAERYSVTDQIGEHKREHRLVVTDPDREVVVLKNITDQARELALNSVMARKIWRLILDESATRQQRK